MALDAAASSIYTIYLFTVQDFVTCLFPVTAFACVAGPVSSPSAFVHALLWHYAHLLHCNLANQYNGREEDAVNKPWRPIAAGRISVSSAFWLRWALPVVCIALSVMYGERLVMTSLALTVVTVLYDEMAFSSVWFTKNLGSVLQYTILETGTSMLMRGDANLDSIAIQSLLYSACLITSTIHCADFPDIDGDRAQGRTTLPILFPKASRAAFFVAIAAWSWYLVRAWALGICCASAFIGFGLYIGWRVIRYVDQKADKRSYLLYNLWLLTALLLPANARWGVLAV